MQWGESRKQGLKLTAKFLRFIKAVKKKKVKILMLNIKAQGQSYLGCRLEWLISEDPWRPPNSKGLQPSDRGNVHTRLQSTGSAGPPHLQKHRWAHETRSGRAADRRTYSTSLLQS